MAKKLSRKEIRENLYQLLFRTEFHNEEELQEQMEMNLEGLEGVRGKDKEEIADKFQNIIARLQEIDQTIEKYADGWSFSRLAKSDVTALRLAIYEIKFDENVPDGVAINEAVELAKSYGSDKSAGFVNGVLASVVRDKSEE